MAKQLRKLALTTTKDYASGDARQVPTAATVNVYRQGATIAAATNSPISAGETNQTIYVLDTGDITVGDTVSVLSGGALGTTVLTVDLVTKVIDGQGNSEVRVDYTSGPTVSFAAGDRLIPTNNRPTLYSERTGNTTTGSGGAFTTDGTTGYGRVYVEKKFVDTVVSGSGLTTQWFEDELAGDTGGVLNVMDYGGNSATAIQAAVDAAIAGQTVYLPTGQYAIGTTITIAKMLRFVGDGPQATILAGTDKDVDIIKVDAGGERVYIGDMTIQGNTGSAGTGRGIYGTEAHYINCRNLFIQNCPASGIHLDQSNFPLIEHVRSINNYGAGLFLDGLINNGAQARIYHTECSGNDWWGIYIDEHAGVQIDAIAVENNCQDMTNAQDISGADSNNSINAPQLYVNGADGVFIGRIDVEDFQNSPADTGIFLRSVKGAVVAGVTFVELSDTAAGVGLRIDSCEGVTIVGCKFHSMDKGIFVQGGNTTMPTGSPSAVGIMSKNVFIAGNWYGTGQSTDTTTPVTLDYAAETEIDGKNITGEWQCGWMVPRFAATALPTPTHDGMIIYSADTDKLKVRANGSWVDLH